MIKQAKRIGIDPFEYYMKDPSGYSSMNWSRQPNYPGPDFLSSSRKRLVPQLLFKSGILHSWQKKTAVALSKDFFDTLPPMISMNKDEADIAWLIYDLQLVDYCGQERYALKKVDEVYWQRPFLDGSIASSNKPEARSQDLTSHYD
jgi:hypothetical protein